jgi:hypothetical protein
VFHKSVLANVALRSCVHDSSRAHIGNVSKAEVPYFKVLVSGWFRGLKIICKGVKFIAEASLVKAASNRFYTADFRFQFSFLFFVLVHTAVARSRG